MTKYLVGIFILATVFSSYRADKFIDIWLSDDQQGSYYYSRQDYVSAARAFEDNYAKGLAYYAAGDFSNAINTFSSVDSAGAKFYAGNSYANLDRLDEAIAAYEQALQMEADFSAARFNLTWVSGLKELDETRYEDAGGTGGQLEADEIVYDDRAEDAVGEMTEQEMQAQGLSDKAMENMWMRRVQTTPGDFLKLKFSYQAAQEQ